MCAPCRTLPRWQRRAYNVRGMPRRYSMDKRAKAKDHSRVRVEKALIRLLASRSYAAITMTDIAQEAGVSSRTVHRYYRSKDQVLVGALSYPAEALAEELSSRSVAESAKEALGELVEAMFSVYGRHRAEMWAAYSRAADVPELAKAATVAVAAWMSAINDFFSRWGDSVAIDRDVAKRTMIALTSYPTWRGFRAAGGFGSPEAEMLVTDMLCQRLLREGRGSQQQ